MHPDSVESARLPGERGVGGGQTLPRQSSLLDRASDGIPRAHPPLPPYPNSGGGGAAVSRAYVGEGFGAAQNEHQR